MMTFWKRLSIALSFSTLLRYSSKVVAPMICTPLRASPGFKMFAASMAPSAAPAPMMLCISSMNKIQLPAFSASERHSFSLSSKSPLYFAPASKRVMSRANIRLPQRISGTSPFVIRHARPSTTAVFPTPASPTRQGLFFVRLQSISVMRLISLSRHSTGSNS